MTDMHPPHHAGHCPQRRHSKLKGQLIDAMDVRVVSPNRRTEGTRNRLDDSKDLYDETFVRREKSLSDRAA
jgi:hypothetical protein